MKILTVTFKNILISVQCLFIIISEISDNIIVLFSISTFEMHLLIMFFKCCVTEIN